MKPALLIAFLLFFTILSADDDHTNGSINGRAWKAFNPAMKAGYLLGLFEGSELVAEFVSNGKTKQVLFNQSIKFGEVSVALDTFYTDTTNAPVPVIFAVSYVKRKAEGASEAELKELEAKYRRLSQR